MNERSFITPMLHNTATEPYVPPPAEAPSRGQATRAAIVEAGHALFVKQGYHGTSMRRIAQQAGIAPSAIYNHFPGKEALFAAVLDAYHPYRRVLHALRSAQGDTVDAFVRDAARRVRRTVTESALELLPLLFIELVEFQGRHAQQLAEALLPDLADFGLRLEQRAGRLRPVSRAAAMRTFMSLMFASKATEVVFKDMPGLHEPGHDWHDEMLDIFLYGILAQAPED